MGALPVVKSSYKLDNISIYWCLIPRKKLETTFCFFFSAYLVPLRISDFIRFFF